MRGRRQLTQLVIYLGDHRGYKIGNELTKDGEWVWTLGKVVRQRSHQDGKSQKHCYPQWYFLSWFWWQPKHQQCDERQNKRGHNHVHCVIEWLSAQLHVILHCREDEECMKRWSCLWYVHFAVSDWPLSTFLISSKVNVGKVVPESRKRPLAWLKVMPHRSALLFRSVTDLGQLECLSSWNEQMPTSFSPVHLQTTNWKSLWCSFARQKGKTLNPVSTELKCVLRTQCRHHHWTRWQQRNHHERSRALCLRWNWKKTSDLWSLVHTGLSVVTNTKQFTAEVGATEPLSSPWSQWPNSSQDTIQLWTQSCFIYDLRLTLILLRFVCSILNLFTPFCFSFLLCSWRMCFLV